MGVAYATGVFRNDSAIGGAVLLSTAVYGALAGVYVGAAKPKRSDLALTLTIASDVPVTALLFGLARDSDVKRSTAAAVAVSGTLALPLAGLVANVATVDAGAMTLAREAGFWGATLAMTGTAGFWAGRSCDHADHCSRQSPSGRVVGIAGLLGLYGGLAAGGLIGSEWDVSVERARLTTLGGYVGALMGGIVGLVRYDGYQALAPVTIGAALGLGAGFLLSAGEDSGPTASDANTFVPTLLPIVDGAGKPGIAWGVSLRGW